MNWIQRLIQKAQARRHSKRAIRFMNAERTDEAIRELDVAIRLDPQNAWAFATQGIAYTRKADHDNAIANLDESIRLGGAGYLHLCLVNRAQCWKAKGEFDRAMADFTKAKQVAPRATEANLERSFLFWEKGDFMSFCTDLQNGCVIEGGTNDFQYDLYDCPREGAIEKATQVILIDPLNPNGYLKRAGEWQRVGRMDRAAYDLKEALRLAPDRDDIRGVLNALSSISESTVVRVESTDQPKTNSDSNRFPGDTQPAEQGQFQWQEDCYGLVNPAQWERLDGASAHVPDIRESVDGTFLEIGERCENAKGKDDRQESIPLCPDSFANLDVARLTLCGWLLLVGSFVITAMPAIGIAEVFGLRELPAGTQLPLGMIGLGVCGIVFLLGRAIIEHFGYVIIRR